MLKVVNVVVPFWYLYLTFRADVLGSRIELPLWAELASKAAPIVMLALEAFLRRSRSWPLVLGLVFSAVGDVCLAMPERAKWFVPGLASFLVGHLCYIAHFGFRPLQIAKAVPFYAVTGAIFYLKLAEPAAARHLFVPVLVYALTIATMGWRASALVGAKTMLNALPGFLGALTFIVSDSILSWNMFVGKLPLAHLFTMITYYLGQYLIARTTWPIADKSKSS